MAVSSEVLMDELKALRRGRGVQAPGIDRLVGPALREVCGIGEHDGAEVVREKVVGWVAGSVRALPEDLRLAVTTPLALNPEAQHVFLAHRVQWLAELMGRDARTVRRRIDDGLTRLVEAAVRPGARRGRGARDGWRVGRLQVLLRLDGPVPLCTERWTVVAEEDGVQEVPWPGPVPESTGEQDVRVAHGAVLMSGERSPARRPGFRVRLPRSLRAGESHEFALDVRMPRVQALRPAHVFRTPRPCDRLDLVVRFDVDRPPALVTRVGGEFDGAVAVNSVGEVEVTFLDTVPGREYGIRCVADARSRTERRTG
ncbi:hypothetical protein [Umezawaea tangerina]|uniref:Uncharacterized protein n=1 Tax=Umezawaea tangerina TaxID=84725 RepID=A0A2T0SLG8_9PSEU|nr:hypothetical protein [Umezawaea tangerina]PRY34254.1 hypothetical protein CLV43_11727 [Umezawaea tangerina]